MTELQPGHLAGEHPCVCFLLIHSQVQMSAELRGWKRPGTGDFPGGRKNVFISCRVPVSSRSQSHQDKPRKWVLPPLSRYWSLVLLSLTTRLALSLSLEFPGPQMAYSVGRRVNRQPGRSPAPLASCGTQSYDLAPMAFVPGSGPSACCVLCGHWGRRLSRKENAFPLLSIQYFPYEYPAACGV